jgi:hypothetical protein
VATAMLQFFMENNLTNLNKYLNEDLGTLLCVGPLSNNIIDASVDFAERYSVPIIMVASRRQIECREFGGGYVNNWTTHEFIEHVKSKNSQNIFFERDHGGPWQGTYEVKNQLDAVQSMNAAKKSFESDIEAGMDIIHIDPTIPIHDESLNYETILSRLFELYGHISEYGKSKNKKFLIEIGTEEQNGSYTDLNKLEDFIDRVNVFCNKNNFIRPTFIVIQTGAKVFENKNIGMFEKGSIYDKKHLIKNIRSSADIAKKYGIHLKEHNADYLSTENLSLRPSLGIKASNVAPEFGYIETKTMFNIMNVFGNKYDFQKIEDFVYHQRKWEKWTSPETDLKRHELTLLGGHYCFANPEFLEIKQKIAFDMSKKGIDLDAIIKKSLYSSFYKYAVAFGLVS